MENDLINIKNPLPFSYHSQTLIMTNYVGKNWDTTMSGFCKDFVQNEQKDTELSSTFFNLRKLLVKKKSSIHWHIHSFEQYIKSKEQSFWPTGTDIPYPGSDGDII